MEKLAKASAMSSIVASSKKGSKRKKKGRKGKLPTSPIIEEPPPVIYRYGWGRFTPNWLQWFHKPIFLLLCMLWSIMTQGFITNGILRAAPSQIERRFHIQTNDIGIIDSMNDIGGLVTLLPMAHWGGNIHKGRWIAIGTAILALGSFMCAVPHLGAGKYEPGIREEQHCIFNSSKATDVGKRSLADWRFMFFFAQFLMGVGSSPYYTMSITYLDENVSQKTSSIYIAAIHGSGVFGPLLGYLFFFVANKRYGDFDKVNEGEVKIDEKDPRWYGAWWLGPIVSCFSALFAAFVMSGFGRQLPGAAEARKADVDQAQQIQDEDYSLSEGSLVGCMADLSKIWKQIKMLSKNSTYMLLVLAHICWGFVIGGFASFAAKYIQTQFAQTSTMAAVYVAVAALPAAFFGVIVGGGIQRGCRLHCRGNMILSMAMMVATVLSSFGFFMICDTPNFAGVTVPYPSYPHEKDFYPMGKVYGKDLKKDCNSNCGCKEVDFQPVCYSHKENNKTINNTLIFSPCYAGCVFASETEAWNCSCISEDALVKYSLCDSECPTYKFIVFMIGFSLFIFFAYITVSPMQQALLRCVPFDQRTFGLAFGAIFIRLLGPIPGSPAIGGLFNIACILWQEHKGDNNGNEEYVCLLYDNTKLGIVAISVSIVGFSLGALILGLAWHFYKPAPPPPDMQPPGSKSEMSDLRKSPDIKVNEKSTRDVALTTSSPSMIEKPLKSPSVEASLTE